MMVRPTPTHRLAAAAGGLVLIGSVLAACGDVTQPNPGNAVAAEASCVPGKTKKIAFMLKQQTAFRYLNADVPFFKKAVEAAGYEVVFQSAENDANKQVAQAENVLTQGVDAIVIQPVDFNVAASIAEKATAAGVPLASYDDLILGAEHAAFIGRDPKEGGAVGGQGRAGRRAEGQLRADRRRPRADRLDRRCRRATTRCSTRWSPRATSRS